MSKPKHPSPRELLASRPLVAPSPEPSASAELRAFSQAFLASENLRRRIYVRSVEICTAFVFVSRWFQGSPLDARVEAAIAWVHFNDELQRVGLERM